MTATCKDCGERPVEYVGCGQCGECYRAMLEGMAAREAAGDCYWCGATGAADECPACMVECPRCREPLTGAAWGSRGLCLSCYESQELVYVDAPIPVGELDAGGSWIFA